MKKIIIAAVAIVLTLGVLPSCTKRADIKVTARYERSTSPNMKDIGTAD
ncbi:hypothetical protein INP83_13380 [Mucilaginibacter sp. 21P]|nr:hypothetical protein [Mucilaginibacter sp. 21P]QXV64086.1 hypothetical protein INP83_13380 [Mucilaginibacter sp. 21P]